MYGNILKVRNILSTFDDFNGLEILTERDFQDYHSMYIDLYNEFRRRGKGDAENVNDDIVFESFGVKIITDEKSLAWLDGTELDFAKEGLNEGFKFNNPNVKNECGCGESFHV